jgi:D-beta-D-heptose 7-phosphate kinase / D-beta-D-heptose 1-phosphate adenosyltransferase
MDKATPPLRECIKLLSKAKVLCVGDIILDKFVYGDVERISPEAPIPVFNIKSDKLMLGGAGNVASNLSGLGAKTRFITVIGNDLAGNDVKKLITSIPNMTATLIHEKKRRTSIKTRYIAGGQQMMRTDDETIALIQKETKHRILKLIDSALNNYNVLVIADYAKGVLTPELIKQLITQAKKAEIPVIVDPQGNNYKLYKGVDIVTPNRKELSLATGMPANNDKQIRLAANKLISEHNIKSILATRSGDGMTLINSNNFKTYKAEAQEIFDVSGAGDTVVATISASLSAGIDLKQAVQLANISAGIVVAKTGTAVAYASDIVEALGKRKSETEKTKILSIKSVVDRAKDWRAQKLKVGFTNGCFDLLHPGHIATINAAKMACDKLIVGLNSNASVQRLKGDQRPIQSEEIRAQILSSLMNVDAVLVFSEDTPVKLLEKLKPDVFIKGGDYKIQMLPEATTVQAYGGKIILTSLLKGYSTTATISKFK